MIYIIAREIFYNFSLLIKIKLNSLRFHWQSEIPAKKQSEIPAKKYEFLMKTEASAQSRQTLFPARGGVWARDKGGSGSYPGVVFKASILLAI